MSQVVYKIFCKNDKIKDEYIGSTNHFLIRRSQHKSNCKKKKNLKVYNFINANGGWENWEMIILLKFTKNSNIELKIKEKIIYELSENRLNTNSPHATKQDKLNWRKNWILKNPDYQKNWNLKNRDLIYAHKKQLDVCECSKYVSKNNINRHRLNSKYHLEWEKNMY